MSNFLKSTADSKMSIFLATLSVWVLIAAPFSANAFPKRDDVLGNDVENEDKTAQRILSAVNKYRILHGMEPLAFDQQMSAETRQMAEKMMRGEKLLDWPYGKTTYTGVFDLKNLFGPQDVVKVWYAEGSSYDWKNPEKNFNKDGIGNFTQMIWKGSQVMGFGSAHDSKGTFLVLCSFNPPGNLEHVYKYNVLSAITQSDEFSHMEGKLTKRRTSSKASEQEIEDAQFAQDAPSAAPAPAPAPSGSSVAPGESSVAPGTVAPKSGAFILLNANPVTVLAITIYVAVKMQN